MLQVTGRSDAGVSNTFPSMKYPAHLFRGVIPIGAHAPASFFLSCPVRLDFVRPLDERIPSDGEDEDEDDSDESASQHTSTEKPRKLRTKRNPADETSAGHGGDAEAGILGGAAVDGKSPLGHLLPASGDIATSVSDRDARRLGRRRNRGMGIEAAAAAAAAAAQPSTRENPTGRKDKVPAVVSRCGKTCGGSSRRSVELASRATSSRKGENSHVQAGAVSGSGEEEVDGAGNGNVEEGGEEDEEENEGLPVVHSVEELRRFVRREGAVFGHGRCLWADTHAHHVVSRRLRLTILFVDMVRTATGSGMV